MAGGHLDDARRAGERRVGADEDEPGAGGDEAIHQILREPQVDVCDSRRRRLATVAARIVDIGVEPVLVGDVWDARAVSGAEVSAVRAAEVADGDPRRAGVCAREVRGHPQEGADQPGGRVPAPARAADRAPLRIPG